MESVNRAALIVKPRQPFVDWANSTPGEDKYTLQDLTRDNLTFLIPEYNSQEETLKYVKKIFHQIFEWQLFGWYTDENVWPKNRNWKMFLDWFEIEMNSEVFDLAGSSIVKESL